MIPRSLIAIAVLAALPVTTLRADDIRSVQVIVRCIPRNDALPPATGKVILQRIGSNEAASASLSNGGAVLQLPLGSVWEVSLDAPGWWAPAASITAGGAAAIDTWRTADVRGRIVVERRTEPPREISVAIEGPIARGARFSCPVAEDGTFQCRLPATKLDVAIRATGFAPHYRWDVVVGRERRNELQNVPLKKGASFVAWLERDFATTLGSPARARLVRIVAPGASAAAMHLSVPVAEADFGKRGFLQMTALHAGTYALEVAADGFAHKAFSPIEIHENRETVFRNLIELEPPIDLRVTVDPPRDASDRPWRVLAQRRRDLDQPSAGATTGTTTDEEGGARITGQSPGRFRIQIEDSAGNRVYEQVHTFTAFTASQSIAIEQIEVTGRVTMGRSGVPAEIWFGGRDGPERVRKRADDDGRFRAVLPRAGKWLVATHLDPDVDSLENFDIPRSGAELAIELSQSTVSGWVVDEDGRRVSGARVVVMPAGVRRMIQAHTDAAGEFRVRGLRPGRAGIAASGRDESRSRGVTVDVPASGDVTGVELRLARPLEIRGRVQSGGRPVAGAVVDIVTSRTTTDVDGRFSLKLNHPDARVPATIAAPGRTLNAVTLGPNDDGRRFEIAPAGGTVIVLVPDGRTIVQLFQNDVPIFGNSLRQWVIAHGGTFPAVKRAELPNMAPGQYRACTGPVTQPRCAVGTLGPAGTLSLVIR